MGRVRLGVSTWRHGDGGLERVGQLHGRVHGEPDILDHDLSRGAWGRGMGPRGAGTGGSGESP